MALRHIHALNGIATTARASNFWRYTRRHGVASSLVVARCVVWKLLWSVSSMEVWSVYALRQRGAHRLKTSSANSHRDEVFRAS